MIRSLFIIGSGSHSNVVIDIAFSLNYKINFIIDINLNNKKKETKFGIPVKNKFYINKIKKNSLVFLAIGDNLIRKKYYKKYKKKFKFINLISKSSKVSVNSVLGEGNYVGPNVVVNSGVIIKNNCILNSSSVIEHDVIIEDNVHICPSVTIGGNCKVGKDSFIGIGSIIINKIKIGSKVILGAGSLVTKNLKSNNLYYGSPAKKK